MSKPIDEGLARALVNLAGRALRSQTVRQTARTAALAGGATVAWRRRTDDGNRATTQPSSTQPSSRRTSSNPDFSSIARGGNAGYIPQRTNNPGNITYGGERLGQRLGATGSHRSPNGRTYYTFDRPETGFQAMHSLMSSRNYRDLPGDQALHRWVQGPNNPEPLPAHYSQVFRQQGIDLSKPYSQQDPVKWARAKAQAEGFYARRNNESTNRLSKADIIERTVSTYAPVVEQQSTLSLDQLFVEHMETLPENHAIFLLKLFNDLSEENQETMFDMVQTEEGLRELLDFAIDKYMASKN